MGPKALSEVRYTLFEMAFNTDNTDSMLHYYNYIKL